jgi:hypothetical protein
MLDRFDLRESSVRRSTVFPPSITGRSYISTALVNESVAYADDLRKYFFCKEDHEFKICPTIRKPTLETT